jgi:hypothetical protein
MKFQNYYLLLLALLCFVLNNTANAQIMSRPKWAQETIYFETAKIKHFTETKPVKLTVETFKTCKITINDANSISPTFTVDIPDIFYVKDAETYSTTYKIDGILNENVQYTITKGEDLFLLQIFFTVGLDVPDRIMVTITTNPAGKPLKAMSYILSEIKD